MDRKAMPGGITLAKANASDHQCFLVDHLFKKRSDKNARLIVVDCAISHFRDKYIRRDKLSKKRQKYLHNKSSST